MRGLIEDGDNAGKRRRGHRRAAYRRQASITGPESGGTACRSSCGSEKGLRTDQRGIVVRRRGQGEIGHVAMAVSWSEGRLPGWFGENRAHASAAGGKASPGSDRSGRIIPGHLRNVNERRAACIGGPCR